VSVVDELRARVAEGIRGGTPVDGELASFEAFFRANPPASGYKYGRHTTGLMDELQAATDRYDAGESVYLIVNMPPRHGKSDVVSRRFPAWFLANHPDDEVIEASYNFQLASEMSFDVRKLVNERGERYGVQLQKDRKAIGSWRVRGRKGALHAAGIGGTITGKGAHLMVIDDYLKNRAEAESQLVRDKQWHSLESDLMTRLAPVHIVVIVANCWQQDDIVGRIRRRNDPKSEGHDPDFPVFRRVVYRAREEAEGGGDAWLFPERFSADWYRRMRAIVGGYAWNAQYQQEPKQRHGNFLRADLVDVIAPDDVPKGLTWFRGWDLASTEERLKDDPDWTVGTLVAYWRKERWVIIKDVRRGRWGAVKRDEVIVGCAREDGRKVTVRVEAVAGYKDTYVRVRSLLSGLAVVHKVVPRLKVMERASVLEPSFEGCKVKLVRGPWNRAWREEMASVPEGHDDQLASLLTGIEHALTGRGASVSAA